MKEVDRIAELALLVCKQIPGLFDELRDSITEACTVAVENAQEDPEGPPAKVNLPISVKWCLDSNAVEVSLAVAVKRKATKACELDDPNQPKLGLEYGE